MWRAEDIQMERWTKVAWNCLHMPRYSKRKRARLEDFHPIMKANRQSSLKDLDAMILDMKDKLPDRMEDADIDAQWARMKKSG